MKIFKKAGVQLASRAFSSEATEPFIMRTLTWLPAYRHTDLNLQRVVKVAPIPSRQAKEQSPLKRDEAKSEQGVVVTLERFGHASTCVLVNFKHPALSAEIKDHIMQLAKINKSQFDKLVGLDAYVSWFPVVTEKTGRQMTAEEKTKLLSPFDSSHKSYKLVEARMLHLFSNEYKVESHPQERDFKEYGKLQNHSDFLLQGIKTMEVIKTLFAMMNLKTQGDRLVLDSMRPEATYFGLDIIRECRLLAGGSELSISTLPAPEHVCTTATLRLIRAAMGMEMYLELMHEIVKKDPTLSHDFLSIELINALVKAFQLRYTQTLQEGGPLSSSPAPSS